MACLPVPFHFWWCTPKHKQLYLYLYIKYLLCKYISQQFRVNMKWIVELLNFFFGTYIAFYIVLIFQDIKKVFNKIQKLQCVKKYKIRCLVLRIFHSNQKYRCDKSVLKSLLLIINNMKTRHNPHITHDTWHVPRDM